jgi:2-polyprenyl-6-methoxyphenol hydroxylase-like FAD-dependent oxidoreductase
LQADNTAIVVGASSCGLACALLLAQGGHRVHVLEARADPRGEAGQRALADANHEVAAANLALRRIDIDAAASHFRSAGRTRSSVWGSRNRNLLFDAHSLRFLGRLGVGVGDFSPLREFDTHLGAGQPSIFIRYGSRRPSSGVTRLDAATMVAQRDLAAVATISELEANLREAAERCTNIVIEYGAAVHGCVEEGDRVFAMVGADARSVTGDLLVVADGGGRRALSSALAIERLVSGAERVNTVAYLSGTQGAVLGHRLDEAWIDARATQHGWLVFLNSGRGLLTVNSRRVVGSNAPSAPELAAEAGIDFALAEEPVDFAYRLDRASRFVVGERTLIVGDAACRASPAWAFGAQFALLWAQMVGDFDAASAGADRARRMEALATFCGESERVARMRLEFEQNAIRIVDFAHAGIREASHSAIPENLLSSVDRAELRFRATAPAGGKLDLRLAIDLEKLFGGSSSPDFTAFCRAVGRVEVDGAMNLRFESGAGKSAQTATTPFDYRTSLGTARMAAGNVSVGRNPAGYWTIALAAAELVRTAHAEDGGAAQIERAELRLPDEFVTALLQGMTSRLWALGAMRRQPLCFEMELRPGRFEIGTFALQLRGAPLVRVTVSARDHSARFAFELLRGEATARDFSAFVRRTPLAATRPVRLWQSLLGRFADPLVDIWAAGASRLIRRVDFEVTADGTGSATYVVAGLPVRVSLSQPDVDALVARLFDSRSCERIMRQYQQSVLSASMAPSS